jgi:peptidoglycan L-alanyl-D-glutamate endopeptidase CwlK
VAVSLNDLDPEFRVKVTALLGRCKARGCEMRPYMSLRSPYEQAKLWRQSRSSEEVASQIAMLELEGANFLAQIIRVVGPQHGAPSTNALPGLSWHQWGEAVDCFWAVNGQAEWSSSKLVGGQNGYQVLAEEAKAMGLTPGGLWTSLKDWPHVQLRPAGSPRSVMTLWEIDQAMKKRFG